MTYPKRLIEVDLPIKRISAHARREKSIRHGHISTLHIWWARRPLAACRAVLCAALWPDPAEPLCPQKFRDDACRAINAFAAKAASDKVLAQHCSHDTWKRWQALAKTDGGLDARKAAHWNVLRFALLDFIADFADWDNSTVPAYFDTARSLTQSAHESLGGAPDTRPLVVDPFAGGGSIPLEALRLGADVFASDLNPIPILLNKVVLEYVPRYGKRVAAEVRKWGEWINREAEKELAAFYPKDADGAKPIAYLWARTIKCEGPACGAEVPLIRSQWLARTSSRSVALHLIPNADAKRVDSQIITKQRGGWVIQGSPEAKIPSVRFDGTVKRGSATCPCCGYTTPVARVREQLKSRRGGANDARLLCVVTIRAGEAGRSYRLPTSADLVAIRQATAELANRRGAHKGPIALVPDEPISLNELRRISIPIYGMESWGDVFSNRQNLLLHTLARLGCEAGKRAEAGMKGVLTVLFALALGRQADACSSLARWHTTREINTGAFGRQALGMVWDFCEINPFSGSSGGWEGVVQWIAKVCESQAEACFQASGQVQRASATAHPLSDNIASAWITDPPYYDAVPYAHLSDYFYVWLRRMLYESQPELFGFQCVPKEDEVVVDRPHSLSQSKKDVAFYERELTKAFAEGRRVLRPDGVGAIVFASKTTASWEAILKAVVDAGWTITGSWPIDTEMEARVSAQGQARLASSVHLVCRPRAASRAEEIGEWRDVLQELPRRVHEWMPRLAGEGVVGADAIFACLGPALEIFSRHSRVERADGSAVTLKEYLEHVWAAVSKEALSMIFEGADTTGFEEDARLTAMWLWTLSPGAQNGEIGGVDVDQETADDTDEEGGPQQGAASGFALEFDAARKIAQGLGAHLENLTTLVEIKGETARLLSVSERTRALFGKDGAEAPTAKRKKSAQLTLPGLIEELEQEDSGWSLQKAAKPGDTTLDRLHQAMILFASGRAEALRRFLVDEGVGKNQKFWRLAQALNALYPPGTDERRWVEGVLARKKGLGL